MSGQGTELYLSPNEQDLLVAALNSNQPGNNRSDSQVGLANYSPTSQMNPGSGQLAYSDDSPYLDFQDGEFDDSNFDFDPSGRMIGDLPDDDDEMDHLHDKRKSMGDGDDDIDEGGGKRREGEDKTAKKPGRKPLTSEPTSKRKAQNRAAQRAFRERKEQHLKDLETKVEELEKNSESATHENGLLRAQVERLQVELKEYRKRLSWISSNGSTRPQNSFSQPKNAVSGQSDFQFEFPKFGDLPAMSATKMFPSQKPQGTNTARSTTLPAQPNGSANRVGNGSTSRSNSQGQPQRQPSQSQSPLANNYTASPPQQNMNASVDSLTGLFSPSILEATRHASAGGYFPGSMAAAQKPRGSLDNRGSGGYSNSSVSNTDSPGSSSESHNAISSIGTSPEPSLNSPGNKLQELGLNTINEENQYGFGKDKICKEISRACGCAEDPIPPILNMSNDESLGFGSTNGFGSTADGFGSNNDISWMAQQNNGTFDPVLFGDYRDTQDNILSQDFGTFFNDAYPLPDLGSPLHNYTEVAPEAPKVDLIRQVDAAKEGEEVVPDTDKPMSCNKIWDRLQSMEKFRNGEIDIDNLCSELRAKAKCSEGGAVVDKKDVDKILGAAKA